MTGLVKLRMTWSGEPPMIGEYLASARARNAYLIVTRRLVEARIKIVGNSRTDRVTYALECERRPVAELKAEGARVHEIAWHPRKRRRRR